MGMIWLGGTVSVCLVVCYCSQIREHLVDKATRGNYQMKTHQSSKKLNEIFLLEAYFSHFLVQVFVTLILHSINVKFQEHLL